MTNARAFTLLELLVATALSTLLIIGLMSVITSVAQTQAQSDPLEVDAGAALDARAVEAWVALLREDLNHASATDVRVPNQLTLMGYAALEGAMRRTTHRPVQVRYRFESIGGRTWMVRRQRAMDVLTSENEQRDLVFAGATRFQLIATPAGGVEADGAAEHLVVKVPPPPKFEAPPEDGEGDGDGGARGSGGGTVEVAPDEDESVLFNGLYYYRKHVPDWVNQQDASTTVVGGDPGSANRGGPGAAIDEKKPPRQQRGGGVVWRLRIWTDDGDEPTFDRIVTTQWVGGA